MIIDLLFQDIYDTYVMDLQSSDYEPILHDTIYQTGNPYNYKQTGQNGFNFSHKSQVHNLQDYTASSNC